MSDSLDRQPAPRSLHVELRRDVRAPGVARAAVAEELAQAGIDGRLGQTIVLLVSEVVSNAVRHSPGPGDARIDLQATIGDRLVRVEVSDPGQGFTPRERDPERLGDGYGLYLLDKTATSWGVDGRGGTTVWFELER